ncbi:hypothetical protein ACED96_09440 [Clostridium thermobutyricum]
MKKTILLNLSNLKIEGDVIDYSLEDFSLIQNENNSAIDEIAITTEASKFINQYDSGILFFNLNNIWTKSKREEIIDDITDYIKKDGYIYIWDLNKSFGEIVDVELKVLCPDDNFKKVSVKNNNIFACLNIEEIEKILEKNCKIEETKVWEDMFFIKAQKI